MLLSYRIFSGFVPIHQEEFMSSMKEMIESHKKEQQLKHQQQKMVTLYLMCYLFFHLSFKVSRGWWRLGVK